MSYEEAMMKVRDDDLDQLRLLFERYHQRLYLYFKKMCGDSALSEDLTHNVFERVIKSRKTFVEMNSFQGWVFRIAKNTLTDHYRGIKTKIDANVSAEEITLTCSLGRSKPQNSYYLEMTYGLVMSNHS